MILNLVVIAALLGITVLWSTYGFFSAFIQVVVAVIAGTLAFAIWEPLTVNVLLGFMPSYAWAAGLLLPFGLFMILLRVVFDKAAPSNLKFTGLLDQALGGLCGLAAAAVIVGTTVLGLQFLPLPFEFLGYRPMEVKGNGLVEPVDGAGLWVPVDRVAAGLYTALSARGFASGSPLHQVYPDLAVTAAAHRAGRDYDDFGTLASPPAGVTVDRMIVLDRAVEEVDRIPFDIREYLGSTLVGNAEEKVVIVETTFNRDDAAAGTFDSDRNLRIPPYQAPLLTRLPNGTLKRHLPVAFTKENAADARREFFPVSTKDVLAGSTVDNARIAWIYAVPSSETIAAFGFRNMRFGVDAAAAAASELTPGERDDLVADLIGEFRGEAAADAAPVSNPASGSRVSGEVVGAPTNHVAVALEQTAALPSSVSANAATGLEVSNGEVTGGFGVSRGNASSASAGKDLATGPGKQMVRVEVKPAASRAGLTSRAASAAIPDRYEFSLRDTLDRDHYAVAYAWQQGDEMTVDFTKVLRNGADTPIDRMSGDDTLYLYFEIPPGVQISRYQVHNSFQEVDFTVAR